MNRYGIADYLTLDQRRAMIRARYNSFGRTYKQRVTGEGCCPLGVLGLDYAASPSAPDGRCVALALLHEMDPDHRAGIDEESWLERVTALASAFTGDWDNGIITPADLPHVLGVSR